MKRIAILFTFLVLLSTLLGCNGSETPTTNAEAKGTTGSSVVTTEGKKSTGITTNVQTLQTTEPPEEDIGRRILTVSWEPVADSEELVARADRIFTGRVVGIDFRILDSSTLLAVDGNTPAAKREIHTVYTVEVLHSYKGDNPATVEVCVMGGMVDYREEDQQALIASDGVMNAKEGILFWESFEKVQCAIGGEYLFTLSQSSLAMPTLIHEDHSILDLQAPDAEVRGISVNRILALFE